MKQKIIKKSSTVFLRAAILAIGSIVLLLCIFALPALWRGVASEYPDITYVFYGILAAMYVAALPFFAALYQALRMLKYIDEGVAFSELSVKALKYIAWCGVAIGLVFAATLPLFYQWAQNDDAPGLILVCTALVGASLTVSVFALLMKRLLSEAIMMKSENDLTV